VQHSIRRYLASDEAEIVELSLRAWASVFDSFAQVLGRSIYDRVYPDWKSMQTKGVQDALSDHETWIATVDDSVAGFVTVRFDTDDDSAEIWMIAVDPAHQGSGIASELTDLAVGEARRRGLSLITVSTGGDPGHAAARATYEKAGFTAFPQVWYVRTVGDEV
jgi:ribosomal protein S18 acetylase RimI-like enzyme